jgi:hypothetical protein
MMKQTGCRLQLRGAGDRDASAAAGSDSREPLHVVVKPGVDGQAVAHDPVDMVRRIIDEIANFGKPLGLDAPGGPQREPVHSTGTRCLMGSACPKLNCEQQHPRLPGLQPPPVPSAQLQFFIVRSITLKNIQTSVRMGVWATSKFNTQMLLEAFEKADHVVLIFSANQTGHFQGYARMSSLPDRELHSGLWGRMSNRLGDSFKSLG